MSFVNPPVLKLDFTGAANVADFSAIDDSVRNTILGILNSMFTLPNRYLVKLDANNDYFKTYLAPLGALRVTVEKASGFEEEAKGGVKKLFAKITRAAPDCYVKATVGAETPFQTKTIDNKHTPSWNETHDFVVSDMDQCVKIELYDSDINGDDEIGMAVTTVKESLKSGGHMELPLLSKSGGEEVGGTVSFSVEYFEYVPDSGSFNASQHKGEGKDCGVATVLVAGATGIKGDRAQLKPSVKVTWGDENTFQTAQKSDAPGTDINNPSFDQNFRIPIDSVGGLISSPPAFHIGLMDGEKEVGSTDVPFDEVKKAKDMILQKDFDVGNGAKVKAAIRLMGLGQGGKQLPDRTG